MFVCLFFHLFTCFLGCLFTSVQESLGLLYLEVRIKHFFERLVTIYQFVCRNIPEKLNHQQLNCQNLKSYTSVCNLEDEKTQNI